MPKGLTGGEGREYTGQCLDAGGQGLATTMAWGERSDTPRVIAPSLGLVTWSAQPRFQLLICSLPVPAAGLGVSPLPSAPAPLTGLGSHSALSTSCRVYPGRPGPDQRLLRRVQRILCPAGPGPGPGQRGGRVVFPQRAAPELSADGR